MIIIEFLGNEGHGLRPLIARQCTDVLYITRAKDPFESWLSSSSLRVDSLNVAVASGILLHQLLGPRLTLT